MISVRAVAAILTTGLLTGCVPFPNVHYFAPAISGIVMRDGHPVVGAEVRVAGQFAAGTLTSSTQESGRFSVDAIRELRLTAVLLGDPLYGFTVQVIADGVRYDGYADAGVGDAPSTLQLTCDLSRPVVTRNKPVYCSQSNNRG